MVWSRRSRGCSVRSWPYAGPRLSPKHNARVTRSRQGNAPDKPATNRHKGAGSPPAARCPRRAGCQETGSPTLDEGSSVEPLGDEESRDQSGRSTRWCARRRSRATRTDLCKEAAMEQSGCESRPRGSGRQPRKRRGPVQRGWRGESASGDGRGRGSSASATGRKHPAMKSSTTTKGRKALASEINWRRNRTGKHRRRSGTHQLLVSGWGNRARQRARRSWRSGSSAQAATGAPGHTGYRREQLIEDHR